ncbi:MAG: hypothetical protein RL160_267 [Bacteroidota bacterium]|jgi:hypothetical protein
MVQQAFEFLNSKGSTTPVQRPCGALETYLDPLTLGQPRPFLRMVQEVATRTTRVVAIRSSDLFFMWMYLIYGQN